MTIVFNENILANRLRAFEFSQWKFVSRHGVAKKLGGGAVIANALGLNLLCQFRKAAGPTPDPSSRLSHTLVHYGTSGPRALLDEYRLTIKCMGLWEKAKQANDFSIVAPTLQKVIDVTRAEALQKAEKLGLSSAYDAVLDFYMPGLRGSHIEKWIPELVPFCHEARDKALKLQECRNEDKGRTGLFPLASDKQFALFKELIRREGVDIKRADLGLTPHPLCMGTGDSVGVGVRINEQDFLSLYTTAMHEGGHALYRQSLAQGNEGLKAQIAGAGLDEAMALLMERHVGRDRGFTRSVFAELGSVFGIAATPDELSSYFDVIDQSGLRTQADEIRYPLDVILRYQVEKALFDDGLKVADLPKFWQEKFKLLTGMDVPDDRRGPLQDIHMYGGAFGWSPNYLYGQLAAAQIFEAACRDDQTILPAMEQGSCEPMVNWLQEHVYCQGRPENTMAMVRQITGRELDVDAYKRHIEKRYLNGGDAGRFRPHSPNHPPSLPLQ